MAANDTEALRALVPALQSMRDRMMAALPPTFGDAFDGDMDTLLDTINAIKRTPAPAAMGQEAHTPPPVPYDRHEREMLELIDQRDFAQSVVTKLYSAVMREEAREWSSSFGFMDAVDEVNERMAAFWKDDPNYRMPRAPRAEAVDVPATAVEADDLPREDETEDEFLIRRLSTLLAEIAVIVKGPEPARTSWSYHDLPDLVRALKARVTPARNLPPNPPPAKPARVIVTHEIAARGPGWLREDMLALADGVERGEITGVLWPQTLREWAAALNPEAPDGQ